MHRTQRCAWRTCANESLRYPPFDYSEGIWVSLGGGSADFIFMGARIFLSIWTLGSLSPCSRDRKKGVITKGVFSPEESLESLKSRPFSRISGKWPDSPLFSTVWGFSKISRISKFSREWTFLKRPLCQKNPFSEPDVLWILTRNFRLYWFLFLSLLSCATAFATIGSTGSQIWGRKKP